MTKTSESEVFEYCNFFTSHIYDFQKQVQNILEVYFIAKFLMHSNHTSKYTFTNHFLHYFQIIFIKLQTSKNISESMLLHI